MLAITTSSTSLYINTPVTGTHFIIPPPKSYIRGYCKPSGLIKAGLQFTRLKTVGETFALSLYKLQLIIIIIIIILRKAGRQ